ncbi:MAG: MBL fold metallo-hydrolase [Pseudomonadota bacterium]
MINGDVFSIKFWGTRGSIAVPGPSTVRFGGNTSCFEIRVGEEVLVIDGGSGLMNLGHKLLREGRRDVKVFFTHTHWDHICGIPFFAPAYSPDTQVHFYAGHLVPQSNLESVLVNMMMKPLFPVPLDVFRSCQFNDFECGKPLEPLPGVLLKTCWLNHPNGACGFRIEHGGKSICIITDTEHRKGELDEGIVDFCRNTDIMVYDAMFTDDEYERHVGWGHSTWQEAIRVGDAANVDRVVLFHHNPMNTDERMLAIEAAAAAVRPGTVAAREGMELVP